MENPVAVAVPICPHTNTELERMSVADEERHFTEGCDLLPKAPAILGRTARTGLLVSGDGVSKWFVTECCKASAKGTDYGIVCRACYGDCDPSVGGCYEEAFDGPIVAL